VLAGTVAATRKFVFGKEPVAPLESIIRENLCTFSGEILQTENRCPLRGGKIRSWSAVSILKGNAAISSYITARTSLSIGSIQDKEKNWVRLFVPGDWSRLATTCCNFLTRKTRGRPPLGYRVK